MPGIVESWGQMTNNTWTCPWRVLSPKKTKQKKYVFKIKLQVPWEYLKSAPYSDCLGRGEEHQEKLLIRNLPKPHPEDQVEICHDRDWVREAEEEWDGFPTWDQRSRNPFKELKAGENLVVRGRAGSSEPCLKRRVESGDIIRLYN